MTESRRGVLTLLSLAVCAAALSGCGKKGPPLPPLARIPVAPANVQAVRGGDEVYVSFTVPAANVSGQTPADVSAVDLYAVTAVAPPGGQDLTRQATKIGSYPVRPPTPPSAAAPAEAPARPVPPGFVQGAPAVVRETLTDQTRQPDAPARIQPAATQMEDVETPLPGPLVPPPDTTSLKRHYFLVAVSPRGRESAPSAVVSVPVGDATAPPENLHLDYTASALTLSWSPSSEARQVPAGDPELLPARPIIPPPAATAYHVFEVPTTEPAERDPFALAVPVPLTTQPVAVTEFEVPGPVRFAEERCFVVRPVDTVAGMPVVGRASDRACVTPADTFPPAPPQNLAAIAGVGVINLIWEPNSESDLAGYIVLRGAAPGDMLRAITPTPIRETTYRDQAVEPGVRYIYAVVAVDSATPQNVSGQSNRVEETSRTP